MVVDFINHEQNGAHREPRENLKPGAIQNEWPVGGKSNATDQVRRNFLATIETLGHDRLGPLSPMEWRGLLKGGRIFKPPSSRQSLHLRPRLYRVSISPTQVLEPIRPTTQALNIYKSVIFLQHLFSE